MCKECTRKSALLRYHRSDKKRVRVLANRWRAANKGRVKELERQKRERWKAKVLLHYGAKCGCCKESNPKFLSVDHINGGGSAHRKKFRISNMWRWLAENHFPKGFQILCHNCNQAKHHYGKCPHKSNL